MKPNSWKEVNFLDSCAPVKGTREIRLNFSGVYKVTEIVQLSARSPKFFRLKLALQIYISFIQYVTDDVKIWREQKRGARRGSRVCH